MRQVKSRALENTQYAGGGVHGAWWTNVKKILLVHGPWPNGPWWSMVATAMGEILLVSHLAMAPTAKWSAQMQLLTPA